MMAASCANLGCSLTATIGGTIGCCSNFGSLPLGASRMSCAPPPPPPPIEFVAGEVIGGKVSIWATVPLVLRKPWCLVCKNSNAISANILAWAASDHRFVHTLRVSSDNKRKVGTAV